MFVKYIGNNRQTYFVVTKLICKWVIVNGYMVFDLGKQTPAPKMQHKEYI